MFPSGLKFQNQSHVRINKKSSPRNQPIDICNIFRRPKPYKHEIKDGNIELVDKTLEIGKISPIRTVGLPILALHTSI